MFVKILLVRFGLLNGHLSGKSCPLGWPCVLNVLCLFVILVISRLGFEGGVWFCIAYSFLLYKLYMGIGFHIVVKIYIILTEP